MDPERVDFQTAFPRWGGAEPLVSNLISNGDWNVAALSSFLCREDVEVVKRILLSSTNRRTFSFEIIIRRGCIV